MFSHFGGNPAVIQLLQSPDTDIDKLLDIDSFPAQFRTCNPKLQKYMDMSRYNRLVQYITVVGDPQLRNRSYKYPLVAAEILSIDNVETVQALFKQGKIIVERKQIQQRWVQKQIDQCDSEYCSSDGSNKNIQQFFEIKSNSENIPPLSEKNNQNNINPRLSTDSKKKSDKNSDNGSQGRRSLGGSSVSVTSDDFPFVEQTTKKIKVKQITIRKVEIQIKPLLQQLCQFFEKQVNYTLTAYVAKVLQLLFKKNSRKILRQIFMTKINKSLVKHLQSHAICDFIVNMLSCPQNQAENAREYFIGSLLKMLINNSSDQTKIMANKSIVYILVELNSKLDPHTSKWHLAVMNYLYQQPSFAKIANLIFDNKVSNKNKQIYGTLLVNYLKKLINAIILNAPNTASSSIRTTEQQIVKQLRQKLLSKFQICFKLFIDRLWENLNELSQDHNELPSYVYIKQFQILNILIKNDLFWSRMQLSNQQNIFGPLLLLCNKFSKNNFIHNQIFQLLKQIVHQCDKMPILFKKTFCNKIFLNFCLQTVCQHPAASSPMYRGQCIYLCQALRHNNSDEVVDLKKEYKQKWLKIQQLILQNIQKMNSTLGGFSVKRPHKADIQFKKEDICERFKYFLKGQIPIQKKKSIQEEQLQQISSQGGNNDQWNDWNQFQNYSADQIDDK